MAANDREEQAGRLAAEHLAVNDPTGWFERLYAAADEGTAVVPWDRGAPHRLLVRWAEACEPDGAGGRALVVGCGFGDDAEYVSSFGFETVAFDVAATAVRAARRRFPGSSVQYTTANLLDPPAEWRQAFDLVIESLTVQSLPDPPRRDAIAEVGRMVRLGGTLVVIATARDEDDRVEGPPWPLSRSEVDSFAIDGVRAIRIQDVRDAQQPAIRRWLAEFRRVEPLA